MLISTICKNTKRFWGIFGVLSLSMMSCGTNPEDQLLGKWIDGDLIIEFLSDGTLKVTKYYTNDSRMGSYELRGKEKKDIKIQSPYDDVFDGFNVEGQINISEHTLEIKNNEDRTYVFYRYTENIDPNLLIGKWIEVWSDEEWGVSIEELDGILGRPIYEYSKDTIKLTSYDDEQLNVREYTWEIDDRLITKQGYLPETVFHISKDYFIVTSYNDDSIESSYNYMLKRINPQFEEKIEEMRAEEARLVAEKEEKENWGYSEQSIEWMLTGINKNRQCWTEGPEIGGKVCFDNYFSFSSYAHFDMNRPIIRGFYRIKEKKSKNGVPKVVIDAKYTNHPFNVRNNIVGDPQPYRWELLEFVQKNGQVAKKLTGNIQKVKVHWYNTHPNPDYQSSSIKVYEVTR